MAPVAVRPDHHVNFFQEENRESLEKGEENWGEKMNLFTSSIRERESLFLWLNYASK